MHRKSFAQKPQRKINMRKAGKQEKSNLRVPAFLVSLFFATPTGGGE
jgi:hypothetical protein